MPEAMPSSRRAKLAATIEAMVSPLRHPTPGHWVRDSMARFAALMETNVSILASNIINDRATISSDDRLAEGMSSWSLFERGRLHFTETEMEENLTVIRPNTVTSVYTSLIGGAYSRSAFFKEVLEPAGR